MLNNKLSIHRIGGGNFEKSQLAKPRNVLTEGRLSLFVGAMTAAFFVSVCVGCSGSFPSGSTPKTPESTAESTNSSSDWLKKLSLFYWNMCFFLKNVCRRLDDGVVSTEPISDSLGRTQMANFVNEDGLYDVILDSSRVVDATANKRFRWLILVKNSEVFLTSIST